MPSTSTLARFPSKYMPKGLKICGYTKIDYIVNMGDATIPKSNIQPVVFNKQEVDALPVLGFAEPNRIFGGFQNIFACESTPTNELTFGQARFPKRTPEQTAFEALHRHKPAEFYYIISGRGVIILEGVYHRVTAGHAIYIPGNAEHGFCNPSTEEDLVFVWGFGTDGFSTIEYNFSEKQPDWSKIEW